MLHIYNGFFYIFAEVHKNIIFGQQENYLMVNQKCRFRELVSLLSTAPSHFALTASFVNVNISLDPKLHTDDGAKASDGSEIEADSCGRGRTFVF